MDYRFELAHTLLHGFEQDPHACAAIALHVKPSHQFLVLDIWWGHSSLPSVSGESDTPTGLPDVANGLLRLSHRQSCFVLSWQLKLGITASISWFYLNLIMYICLASKWSPITCAEDWDFIFLWGTNWTEVSRGILRRHSGIHHSNSSGSRKGLSVKAWHSLGSKDGGSKGMALSPSWTFLHTVSSGFCGLILRLCLWWLRLDWGQRGHPRTAGWRSQTSYWKLWPGSS